LAELLEQKWALADAALNALESIDDLKPQRLWLRLISGPARQQ
jgi:hypothetical protein